jgi:ribonucleoside-diphosphate reductase alpha chain
MPESADQLPPISEHIWDAKYRLKDGDGTPLEGSLEETWARVARAAAAPERKRVRGRWEARFFEAMRALTFLPAGRIIAGAGTGRDVTLFNCFVMGRIADDLGSIFDNVKEAALTMQKGGGIGHDFSTLRPAGALVRSVGAGASGPVSFMDVWDAMCRTIMSAGQRRGAMMGTLRCDHPDIEQFIDAKADPGRLRNFNLSVLVPDAFMAAVAEGRPWSLTFAGKVYRTVDARALWDRIMRANYAYAEPGVVFIDRINARNNLAYCETIHATNPCGEQPLPPYGACLLGSINLARLVEKPFTSEARIDMGRLEALAALAVRFLDNVIDVSAYPLAPQRREAKSKRRIGLGVTGLADALIMCGITYGSDAAVRAAGGWMAAIARAAYATSAALASEKGPFPLFESQPFLASPNVAKLDADVRRAIARHGARNGCLTSVAPTGTISLLAGNVSSGIEPVFAHHYTRRIRGAGDAVREELVEDYAVRRYRAEMGAERPLPAVFVTAESLSPRDHLVMQAAVQEHVDSSISKTINCPESIPFEAFRDIYKDAYDLGLKGCTTFRPNPVTGSVLATPPQVRPASPSAPGAPLVSVRRPADLVAAAARGVAAPAETGAAGGVDTTRQPAQIAGSLEAGVVYMAQPLERAPVLAGYTYKLKWAGSDHAIYVTINDIEQNGRRRPFEIFINTKNLEHYAWTVALTRMISAVFRRGGDVTFVVEELKAVFDPQGGQWMDGHYVPSLLAAIGGIIESHMRRIGFLQPKGHDAAASRGDEAPGALKAEAVQARSTDAPGSTGPHAPSPRQVEVRPPRAGQACPRCGVGRLVPEGGCWVCHDCGYSKCG